MLKVREDNRIHKLVSWASPADLFRSFPEGEKLDKWKKTNVAYIYNGRTKQESHPLELVPIQVYSPELV